MRHCAAHTNQCACTWSSGTSFSHLCARFPRFRTFGTHLCGYPKWLVAGTLEDTPGVAREEQIRRRNWAPLAATAQVCSKGLRHMMKTSVLSTLVISAIISLGYAQAPATPTTPSTTGVGAGAKPKPLAQGDKTLLKNTADSAFFLLSLCDKSKNGAKTESVKNLGGK